MFKIKNTIKITSAAMLMATSLYSQATVVTVQTSLGDIQINLFDEATPKTVENFLQYVNSGAYANNVVHRVVDGFVVQSGGFTYTGPITSATGFVLDSVATGAAVVNEPELSNLRGTIAMAKLGGQPDSATSQWYINLDDTNVSSLDPNLNGSGGYTVFGQVIGDGMDIVDDIAAQTQANFGGAFTNLPIRNYTQADADAGADITDDNLVIISDIVVTDATVVTNPSLNPAENTLINAPSGGGSAGGDSGGGGAFGWLLMLSGLGFTRYFTGTNRS